MSEQGPPPGWYPHPGMTGTLCYWSGNGWTEHVAPMPHAPQPAARPGGPLETVGWVCAFLVPIVGFVIGCVFVSQDRKQTGWGMIILSSVIGLFAFAYLVQVSTATTY